MVIDLRRDCEQLFLREEQFMSNFNCGDEDLNDFFNREAILYQRQMLAETVFFRHKSNGSTVCAFSYSASSIKTVDLPGSRRKKAKEFVPKEKSLKAYPGILIGRLGVATEFNGKGIGSQLMKIIKDYCLFQFPHHVRYLLVDAYNTPAVVGFYQKNYFLPVFSTEEQEKETYGQAPSDTLQTRYMFYDMINWRNMIIP